MSVRPPPNQENPLRLPKCLVEALLAHARSTPDVEVCGLVSLTKQGIYKAYAVSNVAPNSSCRYDMNPKELIDVMRALREDDETLLAIYHSHPFSPPLPSQTDIDEAHYSDTIYIIISLSSKPHLAAFRIRDGCAEELPWRLDDFS